MFKIPIILFLLHLQLSAGAQLYLQNGSNLYLQSGAIINLKNADLVNDGLISALPGSKVTFSGNTNNVINGAVISGFSQMEIAKTGTAKLLLQKDIGINTSVNFTSGNIDLNSKNILLQPTALLLGENENSRILTTAGGYVQIIAMLNAPSVANPGNLGVAITSIQNLGNTIIRRGHTSQTNGVGNGSSILRYYEITPVNNSNLNATITLNYLNAELNSLPEANLAMWQSPDAQSWANIGFTARDASANYVQKNNLQTLSRFTLSSNNNVLPLHFISFTNTCISSGSLLNWITANEINLKKFIVEKSEDGVTWQSITALPAANTPGENKYEYTNQVTSGHELYRIAAQDIDGKINYTKAIKSACAALRYENFTVFPNPSTGPTTVKTISNSAEAASLQVLNNIGQIILIKKVNLSVGINKIELDLSEYPAGTYTVTLKGQSLKMIKR